jgi:excisionase family DNA binding protein
VWLAVCFSADALEGAMEGRKSVLVELAAVLLGVSRRTVYYRIRDGRLRTIRMGVSQRVLLDSIEELRQSSSCDGAAREAP